MLFSKFKCCQLKLAGNGASYWKLAVVGSSQAGFQAFWALPRTPSSLDCIRKADMCGLNFLLDCSLILGKQSFDIQLSDLFSMIAKLSSRVLNHRIIGFTGLAITFFGRPEIAKFRTINEDNFID
ncbi:hypothetical protein EFP25_04020 [Lactiplantibacillus pentosus]|nr:hypothetical protein LP314_11195 [Lactiplantibacillus pentosus]MCT3295977.1 hypothetical protein [Lactiplantibacillus pentosus]MCT3298802.1 hypothetical protein [Lactiplantibacillus pentosus]MCT3312929.1 hypothetical protein [Lactiplantibacillus pentosus]MCT3327467.1 hypothetical protein [Lactiplantibacillus pentosus]